MNDKNVVGVDFGTSNSLLAIAKSEEDIKPIPMEGEESVIPTALFFGDEVKFGKNAINAYLMGLNGRFMRGIKNLLGSRADIDGTNINGRFTTFSDLVKIFMNHLKTTAEKKLGASLEDVVVGRPVHFDSDEKEDKAAEKNLEDISHKIGYKNVSFQYEPIAAGLSYEKDLNAEELVLVADLGGGTSDFSVIRLSPEGQKKDDRSSDILANDSVHVAGMDLDYHISYNYLMPYFGKDTNTTDGLPIPYSYYWTASKWHDIRKMYTPLYMTEVENLYRRVQHPELFKRYFEMVKKEKGHHVLFEVEDSKIRLGKQEKSEMDLSEIEDGFYVKLTRQDFLKNTEEPREKIVSKARETIKSSGVGGEKIKSIIYTGGTSLVPSITDEINSMCPNASIKKISTFSAVGKGLALEALRRYSKNR